MLAPFLSEHFSRVVYLWQNNFDADEVLKEHADVVIEEIVGRHLHNFIPSPELIPDPKPQTPPTTPAAPVEPPFAHHALVADQRDRVTRRRVTRHEHAGRAI